FAQSGKGVEQAQIIAWMQANGWLVQDIKYATQIGAKLRSQTNSLRFAAAQSFRGTAKREITKPDVFHENQTLADLRKQFRRDRTLVAPKSQFTNQSARLARGKNRELIDRVPLNAHMTCHCIQMRAVTDRTFTRFAFIDPFRFTFGCEFVLEH